MTTLRMLCELARLLFALAAFALLVPILMGVKLLLVGTETALILLRRFARWGRL